jgi:hypothetical protein
MYLPLVAVLEHVVLTFVSRVKQQVGKICNGKAALNVLMQDSSEASSLSSVFEHRRPFAQLLQAYADMDLLVDVTANASDATTTATGPEERVTQPSGLRPLDPPSSDTVTRRPSEEDNAVEEELRCTTRYTGARSKSVCSQKRNRIRAGGRKGSPMSAHRCRIAPCANVQIIEGARWWWVDGEWSCFGALSCLGMNKNHFSKADFQLEWTAASLGCVGRYHMTNKRQLQCKALL